jgi:TRAP-type uncharacterized transport system substrate-binding protein
MININTFRIILLLTVFTGLIGCEKSPTRLRLAIPTLSVDQEIAEDFSELLGRESTISVALTGSPASDEAALDALIAGDADIALVSNNMPFRSGITTVMPLYPTVLHIGYREGRDTSSGAELLRGAKVFAGAPGSASRLIFETVLSRLELTAEDFSYLEIGEQAPDVFVVFAPISPERIDEFPGFRLLSLGSPDDIGQGSAVDATTLLNPQLEPFVIPVGTYGDATPEPVLTVSVDMLLVARADLDAAVVYDFVHELLRLRPALAALRPGLFRMVSDDVDSSNSTFILHKGLLAYTERDAPTVYERYSGIAEVAVTVLIALISAMFAGVRIFHMRRKNRIDVFYTETMAIRQSISGSTTSDERATAIQKIRELQTKAFEMLVDEKLSADESFRIFVSLSNDVLHELNVDSGERIPGTG